MCESFNNNIFEARDKPIISMLEWIRRRVMHRIQIKKEGMEKYTGEICPSIVKDLEALKVQARNYFVTYYGDKKFEVDCGDTTLIIDLKEKKCSCRMWDLTGIPCKHAISSIFVQREKPEDYVHPYYRLPAVAPPLYRKQPGRPPKMRKKGIDEPRNPARLSRQHRFIVCVICLQKGHNQRSCKGPVHPKSKLFKPTRSNQQQPPLATTTTASSTPVTTYQPTRVGYTFEEFPSMTGNTSASQTLGSFSLSEVEGKSPDIVLMLYPRTLVGRRSMGKT
ncbi:hypothetical protein ACSBR2_037452 [Camellia fascicularis]